MAQNQPEVRSLALAFCRAISEELDPKTIEEVSRLNKTSDYEGICATHDYCDANQSMVEALQSLPSFTNRITNNGG